MRHDFVNRTAAEPFEGLRIWFRGGIGISVISI